MDALLRDLQIVCTQLLPILGAVALFFLCVVFKKIGVLLDSVNETVKGLDPTLKKVDESMAKVQAPLDTVVKYSHTLDQVHDKTSEAMEKVSDFAKENLSKLQSGEGNDFVIVQEEESHE